MKLTLPVLPIVLGACLLLTFLIDLPLWSGFALAGVIGILFWIATEIFLYALWKRESKNLEILADRIDQPVEFRTTVVFHDGRRRSPGYLLLTYDDCYLVARSGGLFAKIDRIATETFQLHKSETFRIHVLGRNRVLMMPNAVEGYQLSVNRLTRLIYLMDRDFWRISGKKITAYLE